jgi:lambda repressor-like predicted transcriptional regulator
MAINPFKETHLRGVGEIVDSIEGKESLSCESIPKPDDSEYFGPCAGGGGALGRVEPDRFSTSETAALATKVIASKEPTVELITDEERQEILSTVRYNAADFGRLDHKYKNDRETVLAAVKQNYRALKYVAREFQNDREIVLSAVEEEGYAFEYAAEELKSDREFILAAVKQNGSVLKYVPREFQNDREIVLSAVEEKGYAFEYAAEELKSDREFILAAVKQNGSALEYVAREFQNDREIVLFAVKEKGYALEYAAEELKSDREFILAAVRQKSYALEYAAEELKSDREFILAAVKQDGGALKHVPREFKNDREIVLSAVEEKGYALEYAAKELKSDREFILAAVKQNGSALKYVAWEFKNDREFILAAVKQNGSALEYVAREFQNDREIVLAAVKNSPNIFPSVFRYASDALKDDEETVLMSFEISNLIVLEISDRLKLKLALCENCRFNHQLYLREPEGILTGLAMISSFEDRKALVISALESFFEEANKIYPIPKELLSKLLGMIGSCKNTGLHNYVVKELQSIFSSKEGIEEFLYLIHSQKDVSYHLGRMFPLIALKGLELDRLFTRGIFRKIYRSSELKDAKKLQIFMQAMSALKQSNLEKEKIKAILRSIFSEKDSKIDFQQTQIISAICKIDPRIVCESELLQKDELVGQLISKFQGLGFVEEGVADLNVRFIEKFLTSNDRNLASIFTYAAIHKDSGPLMIEAIRTFISRVLDDTFINYRNTHNTHGEYLTADQKEKWETNFSAEKKLEATVDVSVNIRDFLRQRLVDDGHGGEIISRDIFDAMDGASTDDSIPCGGAGGSRRPFSAIERLVVRLYQSESKEEKFELIGLIEREIPDDCEFKNDLNFLKNLVNSKQFVISGCVEETDNPIDLLLLGTEVAGSCQRIDGLPALNCCLMGYCLDGKIRTLVVKDEVGRIKYRALMKLLLIEEEGVLKPAIFVDRIYPFNIPTVSAAFIEVAKAKAKVMGVSLYVEGDDETLTSLGNIAKIEYVDPQRIGVTDGRYSFKAKRID